MFELKIVKRQKNVNIVLHIYIWAHDREVE